jgi:1-acyl-sn-glycerol-3-phosphate acyltransferase
MKQKIKSVIITLFVWIVLLLTILPLFLLYFVVWLITLPFDFRRIICHYFVACWSGFYIFINPWWKLTIENRHRIKKGKTYIILANHQSIIDILMLYQLYFPFRWVSKIELFRVPVVGWILYLNKYIPVVRGDKISAEKMIRYALKSLAEGISVLIFPEGTRTTDGNLGIFREGAFKIALESKESILPVVISGAFDALPKDSFWFHGKQRIIIRVLEPLNPDIYNTPDLPGLLSKVQALMSETLQKMRENKE